MLSAKKVIVKPELTKSTLLNILHTADLDQLDVFVSSYYAAKQNGELLEDFFNCVLSDDGFNSLEIAITKDNTDLMAELVFAGAAAGKAGKDGFSPLHLAAKLGALKCLTYLINLRVDLNVRLPISKDTPLMIAALFNQAAVIASLARAKAGLNNTSALGHTAVGIAAYYNNVQALQALIDAKADLDKSVTVPPVIIAVNRRACDSLALLIKHGANINKRIGSQVTGQTALFRAVLLEYVDCVKIILAAPETELDYVYGLEGFTAIFQAALLTNELIFTLLLNHGANIFILANTAPAQDDPSQSKPAFISMRRNVYLRNLIKPSIAGQNILTLIKSRPLSYANEYNFSFHRGNSLPGSTCSYGAAQLTHRFSQLLGQKGSFGEVFLMQPMVQGGSFLAVKEFSPEPLQFQGLGTSGVELAELLADGYPQIINEAKVNYVIYGVGAFFCDRRPIHVTTHDEIVTLLDYPRCYVAMKYFPGMLLQDYAIKSASVFFQIALELLNALNNFHKHFIHCDITPFNIIIKEENSFKYKVNLIDFSFSRPANQALDTAGFYLNSKPPEFKERFVNAAPSLDVYCVGLVLYECCLKFKENLGPLAVENIFDICQRMLLPEAEERIAVAEAINDFKEYFDTHLETEYAQTDTLLKELDRLNTSADMQNDFIQTLGQKFFHKKLKTNSDLLEVFKNINPENSQLFIKLLDKDFLRNITIVQDDLFSKNDVWDVWIELFKVIDNSFGVGIVDNILTTYLSNAVNRSGMLTVVTSCDSYDAVNPQHYHRLLRICNHIYCQNRGADHREYYSRSGRFFAYSKTEKIQASQEMENALRRVPVNLTIFSQPVLQQGQLGEIATRLRKTL
jgi:ankyrin repeat protein